MHSLTFRIDPPGMVIVEIDTPDFKMEMVLEEAIKTATDLFSLVVDEKRKEYKELLASVSPQLTLIKGGKSD